MISINQNTTTARLIEQTQRFKRTHPWLFAPGHDLLRVIATPLMRFALPIDKSPSKESK